ncbi:Pycsar system effector family protein [Streptomyces sp. NPDC088731]|uniref:Pycsar system effector family protein n=1 Tax=Streptomyces sp. NPDC088731 TaxID=3365878 RepID=UPI00382EC012
MTTTTSRIDINLSAMIAKADADLGRTDTKAGHLLTLDGLLVAALSVGGTDLHGLSLVLAVAGAVALIGSVIGALLVIRPRLQSQGATDRASYVYLATADPAAIADALASDRRLARLATLSTIALAKMRLLRISGDATLVAVAATAATLFTR